MDTLTKTEREFFETPCPLPCWLSHEDRRGGQYGNDYWVSCIPEVLFLGLIKKSDVGYRWLATGPITKRFEVEQWVLQENPWSKTESPVCLVGNNDTLEGAQETVLNAFKDWWPSRRVILDKAGIAFGYRKAPYTPGRRSGEKPIESPHLKIKPCGEHKKEKTEKEITEEFSALREQGVDPWSYGGWSDRVLDLMQNAHDRAQREKTFFERLLSKPEAAKEDSFYLQINELNTKYQIGLPVPRWFRVLRLTLKPFAWLRSKNR